SGSWRIKDYKVWPCFRFFQKLFGMFIVLDNRDARHLSISVKVPCSSKTGIHAYHFSQCLRQWQREEPDAQIQIQRQFAKRIGCHGLQQILDQKSVHLKERKI